MKSWLVVLLVGTSFAGCITDDETGVVPPETAQNSERPILGPGPGAAVWNGTVGERATAECTPSTCRVHGFTVAAEPGVSRLLTVAAKWPHEDAELGLDGSDPSFQFDVTGPNGDLIAEGRLGWLGSVLAIEGPEPGDYEVRVWGTRTGGVYEVGAVLTLVVDGPSRDLLPDLITMPISNLGVVLPEGPPFNTVTAPAWAVAAEPIGVRGCGADEWLESQPKRCLRFSNGVANVGAGAVEVRLPLQDAARNILGAPQFIQRVYNSDGTSRERTAGPAEFHVIHGHYHFGGFAQTTLFAYDYEAGARGATAVVGEKLGYCFIDVGVYQVDHTPVLEPLYIIDGCLLPVEQQAIVTGLQPGWFDLYWSDLSHQYIEITGLEDGVYELESIANVEGRIEEENANNNAASVIFRLTGDQVEVLQHL